MSRTDKTKPWRVRVAEHAPREHHCHENGTCDLPPSPLEGHLGVWDRGRCSWSDWALCYRSCCWGCGCPQCNNSYGHRMDRRRDRHAARRWTRRMRLTQDWWSDQDDRTRPAAYVLAGRYRPYPPAPEA